MAYVEKAEPTTLERLSDLLDRQDVLKKYMEQTVIQQTQIIREFRENSRTVRSIAIKIMEEELEKEKPLSGNEGGEAQGGSGEAGEVLS